jgi:hypothetical protein
VIANKTICIVRHTTKVLKNRRRNEDKSDPLSETGINNSVYHLRVIIGTTLESINTYEKRTVYARAVETCVSTSQPTRWVVFERERSENGSMAYFDTSWIE